MNRRKLIIKPSQKSKHNNTYNLTSYLYRVSDNDICARNLPFIREWQAGPKIQLQKNRKGICNGQTIKLQSVINIKTKSSNDDHCQLLSAISDKK